MVNVLEADYGLGPLADVEESIASGIDKLIERNKTQPWFDGLWMNEYGEVLFGSLLVACQAYCLGCVSDINTIRKVLGLEKLKKIDAYHHYSLMKNDYSLIEFVNAAANCFKHRDEWEAGWPDNLTTKTLAAFEITEDTEFPLNQAQEILKNKYGFTKLSELVSSWRAELILNAKGHS